MAHALPRRDLSEEGHQWTVTEAMSAAETPALGQRREFREVESIGDAVDPFRRHTGAPMRCDIVPADRDAARRALDDTRPDGEIPEELHAPFSFVAFQRPVGRQDVGDAPATCHIYRCPFEQVPVAVDVDEIDRGPIFQLREQPRCSAREEELVDECGSVRRIPRSQHTHARVAPIRFDIRPARAVVGIRRQHRDLGALRHQRPR